MNNLAVSRQGYQVRKTNYYSLQAKRSKTHNRGFNITLAKATIKEQIQNGNNFKNCNSKKRKTK